MQGVRIRRDNGRGSPYHMIMRASQTGTPFVYKKYSKKVIVYGELYIRQIFLIQMEYPSAKHV